MFYLFCIIIILLILYFLIRTVSLLTEVKNRSHSLNEISKSKANLKTLIILGSGGHSTEMLRLVQTLNLKIFTPKIYIVAMSDSKSKDKLFELENFLGKETQYQVINIPRSREVHQSYFSSIFTTFYSIFFCVPVMLRLRPDLILCNGPGTCVPICFIAFAMRIFHLSNNAIVFIESICRVKSLSLSGLLLFHFVDVFLVQWEELTEKYKRAIYIGRF